MVGVTGSIPVLPTRYRCHGIRSGPKEPAEIALELPFSRLTASHPAARHPDLNVSTIVSIRARTRWQAVPYSLGKFGDMLTRTALAALKPRDKDYPKADAHGLCVVVQPNGRKIWRYRYRFAGKARTLTLGDWPHVSLEQARRLRLAAADVLRAGRDPTAERKAEILRTRISAGDTFEAVALEWLTLKEHDWTEKNATKERGRLVNHVFPWIGKLPVAEVRTAEVRGILDRIVRHRNVDTAHRVRMTMSCVFRFAIAHERSERDPAHALADFLPAHRKKHFAHITDPKLLGELLRAIHGFTGQYTTACALKLAPLVFLRPGELRQGKWSEVDLHKAIWTIPAARMKLNKAGKLDPTSPPHTVPLSRQSVAILRDLHSLTGAGELMFPGVRDRKSAPCPTRR